MNFGKEVNILGETEKINPETVKNHTQIFRAKRRPSVRAGQPHASGANWESGIDVTMPVPVYLYEDTARFPEDGFRLGES
jgi:hypothetical protein